MMLRNTEELRKDIMEHLLADARTEGADISVEPVAPGEVVLRGTAPSNIARRAALEDASAIPGTSVVHNELKVRSPRLGTGKTHAQLQKGLVDFFRMQAAFDGENLHIDVHDGEVVLRGTVGALWKKHRAREAALEVKGVEHVRNELDVVPSKVPLDRSIAESIRTSIGRTAKLDPGRVQITVEGARVTLSGTVDNWEAYTAAHNAAKYAHGIKDLTNELRIQ